jgi:hypothetical protein
MLVPKDDISMDSDKLTSAQRTGSVSCLVATMWSGFSMVDFT